MRGISFICLCSCFASPNGAALGAEPARVLVDGSIRLSSGASSAATVAEAVVVAASLPRAIIGGAGSALTGGFDDHAKPAVSFAAAAEGRVLSGREGVAHHESRERGRGRRHGGLDGQDALRAPLLVSNRLAMMNVTVVDHNGEAKAQEERVSVVSSWVLIHVMGNHTSALKEPELSKLVVSLRDAIADSLEVCRPSVGIVDIRAINIDLVEPDAVRRRLTHVSLVQHWHRILRNEEQYISHVNVTQIKAVYEVRVFDQMRVTDIELARRIDRFQIYGKFSELARLLVRSFARNDRGSMDGVVLDDVGYASKHTVWRQPMQASDTQDCLEEVMLHDTRQLHQYVVAISLVLVAFITCAGSAVFTIKHPSMIPSRLNPLGRDTNS